MSTILSDIWEWLGFRQKPSAESPISPRIQAISTGSIPMDGPGPMADVDSLPVSCLVLGIVKSMETEWDRWHAISDMESGPYSKGYRINARYMHISTLLNVRCHEDVPYDTDTEHVFNAKESRMIAKIVGEHRQRYRDEFARREREKGKYFENLGCPPLPVHGMGDPGSNLVPQWRPKRRKRST
jgi:hypothetical protein